MSKPEPRRINYDELVELVERLPELYEKYGIRPGIGSHYWDDPSTAMHDLNCGCALEVISLETGHSHWSFVSEGVQPFYEGFDGFDRKPFLPQDIKYFELGKRAARLCGLRKEVT